MPVEFKEFTYAKVTIKTKDNESGYVVSNINTKGEPGSNCGCHLTSIEISSPAYETGNTNSCGTTGKVSLVDYKNSVFNCLLTHMRHFLNDKKEINKEKAKDKADLCPIIDIEMKCYHGDRKWSGYINNWGFQFSGTTPTIEIEFLVLNPNVTNLPVVKDGESIVFDFETAEEYRYATKYLDALNKVYGDNMLKLVLIADNNEYEGVEAAKHIAFPSTGIPFKPQKGVGLLYGFMYFAEYGRYSTSSVIEIDEDYSNKLEYVGLSKIIDQVSYKTYPPLSAKISDDGKKFILTPSSKKGNSNNDLLFVQNGSWAAYSSTKLSGEESERYVIPMTSFSFTTDLFKVSIQHRIINSNSSSDENVNSNNGVIIQQSDGTAKQTSDNKDQAETALNNTLDTASADPINVTFECYNVLTFEANNLSNKIRIMAFDELGNKIDWLDTNLIVRKVTYTLNGGVVKASVEGTTVFNKLSVKTSGGNKGGKHHKNPSAAKPKKLTDVTPQQKELLEKYPDYMEYIRSEDEYPIPLEYDKTCTCDEKTLISYIRKFLNGKRDKLYGKNRNLDYSFVKDLIDNGMYGLLAILYCVSYYGIIDSQVPDYWKTEKEYRWGNDPHNGVPGKELPEEGKPGGQAAWRASDTGKNPYDYTSGLGLPDFDGGQQDDIYIKLGFPAKFEEYEEGLSKHNNRNSKLKAQVDGKDVKNLSELEKAYEHILLRSGTIKWSNFKYKDHITGKEISRRKPDFFPKKTNKKTGEVKYVLNPINPGSKTLTETSAKQYDYWRAYGYLVSYNQSMQIDMFLHWLKGPKSTWEHLINELKKKDANEEKTKTGHTICLQDALRLSKIYNSSQVSANNAIANDLTVKYQWLVYKSRDQGGPVALSHFAYCQRTCRFVEWELIHSGKLKVEDKDTKSDNNSQDNNQQ